MSTPLELALRQLHPEGLLHEQVRLSAFAALQVWMRLFAGVFFALLACTGIAIGACLLLLTQPLNPEAQALASFAGVICLSIWYCLGNILLLQGVRGARSLHNLLLAALALTLFACAFSFGLSPLLLSGLGASLAGLGLCQSERYRSLQTLHQTIRALRRQHAVGSRR